MVIPEFPDNMKKQHIQYTFLVMMGALLLFGTACRSKKRALPKADMAAFERDQAEKMQAVKSVQLDFNTLAFRAKADIKIDGNSNEVSLTCRIAKDQKIWMSVTALAGLEVARILITPDSIHILNRLESVYIKKPISFIHQYTNPQISFRTLESILIGNLMEEILNGKPVFSLEEQRLSLAGRSADLTYQLKFNEALKPAEFFLQDSVSAQELKIQYGDYEVEEGLLLPHQLKLKSAAGKKSIQAELKYNKVERNTALDFPFSVPKRFTVKN